MKIVPGPAATPDRGGPVAHAPLIMRTIMLNGLAGLAFGWLYWRRGLEAAMVSHGAVALILHVAVPAIGV